MAAEPGHRSVSNFPRGKAPDPRFPTRVISQPRAGYFVIKERKGGPAVPARIRVDFGLYFVEIRGRDTEDAGKEEPFEVDRMEAVWVYGTEITADDYRQLCAPPPPPSF